MWKLIIVEDDAIVRKYIIGLLNWEGMNIDIVGQFQDGKQAWDYISENHVDIIITDINMPIMNGVELIKKIKQNTLNIKIIVLTCYSDYDYIHEALKCGVSDYLLKQKIDENTIKEVLIQAIDSISNNVILKQDILDKALKKNFLKSLISGIVNDNIESVKYLKNKNIINEEKVYAAIAVFSNNNETLENNQNSIICRIIDNNFIENKYYCISEIINKDEIAVLLSLQKDQVNDNTIKDLISILEKINQQIYLGFNMKLILGISRLFNYYSEFEEEYKLICIQLKGYKKLGKYGVYFVHPISDNKIEILFTTNEEMTLKQYLLEGEIDKASFFIKKKLNDIYSYIDINTVNSYLLNFIHILLKLAYEMEIDSSSTILENETPYSLVNSFNNLKDFELWIYNVLLKMSKEIKKNIAGKREIMQAIKYVQEHYTEDINLTDISELVHISPNYFSALFKKINGVGFSEYVLVFRLEKAKEYLRNTDLKIYEIAYKVGFSSTQYFNRQFKKYYGETPLNYMKRIKRQKYLDMKDGTIDK